MNRRAFLALGAVSTLQAQRPAAVTTPGAPLPPPPSAKITSSIVLSILKGTFEQRVLIAAKAGIQSVELGTEYASWDDAAIVRARKFTASFNMTIDAIDTLPNLSRAIAIARKLNCPQILVSTLPPEKPEGIAFLTDNLQAVKQAADPRVRLVFTIRPDTKVPEIRDAVDFTSVFRVGSPPGGNLKSVYQAIGMLGYSRYMALETLSEGDPVASLIRTVDDFRAELLPKPLIPSI